MIARSSWRELPLVPFAFVLLATLWGGSFVAIEVGLHTVPPLFFAALRYDIAGVVLLGYAALTTDRWLPRTRGDFVAIAVSGAVFIAAYHALLYVGEGNISGAVASIVISLSPVLTVVVAAALLGERLKGLQLGGIALGFLGVVLVADPTSAGTESLFGIGLVFLAALAFAVGSVFLRKHDHTLPLRSIQAWAMLVGAGLLHLGSLGLGEPQSVAWTTDALISLAYLAGLSGIVAFSIYFALLDEIGPTELNLIGYVEPIVATALSWALLGHVVDSGTVVGFLAILLGFALVKHETLSRVARRRVTV
ncbi:DMT family transporter [Natronomonas sp. EA1]|uniref:DMT family transporter n=1 Tax=Natronomonas sp. EA1 TaxID=3421655 RepID=UPI003EBA689E